MSEDEIRAFLGAHHVMRLATLRAGGGPHIVSMWYGLVDGHIAFSSYAKSQKIVNLARDPRVACQVEEGEHPSEVKGVCVEGLARIVDDPDERAAVVRAVSRQSLGVDPTAASLAAMGVDKRAAVIIEPTRIASWDHAKIDYMRGVIPGE